MFKISSVEGNRQKLDGGAMFGNAPRAVWSRWEEVDDLGRIDLACRSLLIESDDGKKILLETGVGAFFDPKLKERYGVVEEHHVLLESLKALGIEHQDVDMVILSHLHFDHAGGLLSAFVKDQSPRLLFDRAEFVVGKEAWERALAPHPRDRASFIPELNALLKDSGRLRLIDRSAPESLLGGRIHFYFSDGHTPGQMHTMVGGDRFKVFFAGDLVPGRSWVHLPITMGYDRFAEKVIDEKREMYQILSEDSCITFFTHDAHCAAAHLMHENSRYQADPKRSYTSLERKAI